MLASIIGGFILLIVGTALLPVVANQVSGATTGNVTGASATMVNLVTLFYALAVTVCAVAVCISGLQESGLM